MAGNDGFNFAVNPNWGIDVDGFDFDVSKLDASKGDDGLGCPRYRLPRVYEQTIKRPVLYEYAEEFADGFRFAPDYRELCFVSGNFVLGDVLEALVNLGKVEIRRLTIQTLTFSQENVDSLWNVCDMSPDLESLRIIAGGYFWAHEHKPGGVIPYLLQELDQGDVLDIAFAAIHTKMISIETVNGHHIVMHGSANLRSSRSIEQMMVECDDNLYAAVEDFADKVFASYSIIDKTRSKNAGRGMLAGRLWSWLKDEYAKDGAQDGNS